MAAIGKIRSWGPVLVVVIGLALFAFIAEELVRSCNSGSQAEARRVATILGENIDYADYNKLIDEYKNAKMMSGADENLEDADYDNLWQTFVSNKLIQNEAKELGLTVTDEEMQSILNEGTNQVLLQYAPAFFRNQQTGRFDANALKKFMDDYNKGNFNNPQMAEQAQRIYTYWMFVERTVREQLLAMKYQSLLAHCFISNDVEAKMAYDEHVQEASIELAAFPYSSVKESEAKVTDEDIKSKYEEIKERFRIFEKQRDIKYVRIQLTPSDVDRKTAKDAVAKAAAQLDSVADYAEIVRAASSNIGYLGVPMLKSSFPTDIALMLDSMAVGQTRGPVECNVDGTFNAVHLISKQSLPDSIQCRIIQVGGTDVAKSRTTADSIFTAVKGGANFGEIAKKYNQTGDSIWLASDNYLRDQNGNIVNSIAADQKAMIEAVNSAAVGEIRNIALTTGNAIIQVTDRRKMTDKYIAAVVKRDIAVSKTTRNDTYNKFNSFAAQSQKGIAELEAAAKKNGYTVEDLPFATTSLRNIPYVGSYDPATRSQKSTKLSREALKWVFEAKEGEVSGLFECGVNRDEYVVLAVVKAYEDGFLTLDNKQVKEAVKAEALQDKQAEVILKKLNGVKTIAAAKQKGGIVSTVDQITFDSPAAIGSTPEPAISGAVAATKAGQFVSHPVKGNDGIYVFQVKTKTTRQDQYDQKSYKARINQQYLGYAMNAFMSELVKNAKIQDNRYLFY